VLHDGYSLWPLTIPTNHRRRAGDRGFVDA